ncbi:MAG: DJ-1/PfpI family protein [Puniceicoccales bacterium]|jgi:4-methyl-5(b-hydroxyethyl)-thiazole monophosphate biosynthesis|nr:DJ-1/PfpI family protein [Puniceicoccales bacterium]
MSKCTVIIIPNKFEEMEFVCPFDVLLRGGSEVTVAGYGNLNIAGCHGLQVRANVEFVDIASNTYDCVVLPGGPGCYSLRGDVTLKNFLMRHFEAKKLVCAICAAPLVLHDAGILQNKKYTGHPCTYGELKEIVATDAVVGDGNLITGSGPGAAAKFGLKILEHLTDKATADNTARAMLF